MTEDFSEQFARDDAVTDEPVEVEADGGQPTSSAAQRTGNPAVDAVLDSLDGLAGTPVAEHVAVFEAAHDRLRGALADAGETAVRPHG